MKKKNSWILIVLGLVLLLVTAIVAYEKLSDKFLPESGVTDETTEESTDETTEESADESVEETRHMAPDFTVYDAEGKEVAISDFLGKPVILNFWASWCGPCKREMPDFQEVYDQYGESVHFLFVNLTDGSQETVETASQYIADNGYNFPVYYDKELSAARAYVVNSVPRTYFIDEEGYLINGVYGAITKEYLIGRIEEL